MFKSNSKTSWAIFTLLSIGFFGFIIGPVFALTVSPPRIEIGGNPGTNVVGEISLFNEQGETKTFYSSTANFEARGETGAPYFLPERDGLAVWIITEPKVTLEPGERKIIPFTIEIPKNVEPGGYFAAIFWSSSPPEAQEEGQVAIGAKLGVLILLRVAGEVEEAGGLLEFRTENGRFLTKLPIVFVYRFSNDGGDRIKPEGEIKIKNIIGLTSAILDANKGEGNILPRSIRKLEALWHSRGQRVADLTKKEELALFNQISQEKERRDFFKTVRAQWKNFALGLYKADLNLIYGADNKIAKATYRFFVIPWQLLSIILIIFIIIGFIGRLGFKRYNRWIIKKAQEGNFNKLQ